MERGKDSTRQSRTGCTVTVKVHRFLKFRLEPDHKQQTCSLTGREKYIYTIYIYIHILLIGMTVCM